MKRLFAPILNNWFLIGLIALALCAIPGVILVILTLVGSDGGVNKWLQENFQISYELTLSPWVALILLLLPILLVVLYFLKLKRKPVQVPSTFLWKKSIEDLHVNSLFQWLRNNILLLLQLLALLFLIYSILGLRFHGSTNVSKHYILMLDNSASMSAKDVAPDRLTWAKQEALKEIDAANNDDFGMVIVFNSKATTLQTYTNDRQKLREAVDGIQPTQRPTRIEEALALAESLANPVRATEQVATEPENQIEEQRRSMPGGVRGISTVVHLYSDGRFAKLSEATLAGLNARLAGNEKALGNINLRYHMAGKITEPGNTNNLAIIGMNVLRQNLPTKKNPNAQQLLAFVRVANFRSTKASVRLKLDVIIDGVLTHPMQQTLEVKPRVYVAPKEDDDEKDEPGEADACVSNLPPLEPGRSNIVLHAALDKTNDEFPLDDQAWLVVGSTRKAKILIVGSANRILDAFFEQDGTKKFATAERLKPEDLKTESYRKKARSGEFDLVIFDRCAPEDEADMPAAHTFFIDRPPPPWQRGKAILKNPLMMPSKQQHPLMRYLTTIWDVRTHEAFVFDVKKNLEPKAAAALELPDGDPKKRSLPTITRIIETSNQAPLVFTMSRGPHTDVVMAFALLSDAGELVSDWPLQTSFPLFFRNVLYILGNVDDAKRPVSVTPGEPVVLRPEAGFSFIEITPPPANQKFTLQRTDRNEILFADTERLGVYRYKIGSLIRVSDEEKKDFDTLVRGFAVNLLDANESNIEPRTSVRFGTERISTGEEMSQPREIWKWILILAVLLLMVEWLVYHRRISV